MKTTNLIPAPFDDKNLCDDCLRDDIFRDFYEMEDSKSGVNHFLGQVSVDNDDCYFEGIVEVQWKWNNNFITIHLLACPCQEDFFSMREDFFKYYEGIFKEWECPEAEDLRVKFYRSGNILAVSFYFECE